MQHGEIRQRSGSQLEKRLPARLAELAQQLKEEGVCAARCRGPWPSRPQFEEQMKRSREELDRYDREMAQHL